MRILTNQKIRTLFLQIFLSMAGFLLLFALFLGWEMRGKILSMQEPDAPVRALAIGASVFIFCMGLSALALCYRYFREQDKIMGDAVARIQEFVSGNRDARIECCEEGELYRLFHEVNSLAAILNAKAENEKQSRKFLQNTISDISHQLKTPLAALNIYNGIMQTEAETGGLPAIREFTDLSEQELDRIETLVQNLLKITKFDAGSIVLDKYRENVAEMMTDVERQFSFRAGQEGKRLILAGSDDLFFLCDRSWIEEAVGNLVKNALDHTENGDEILVEWGQSAHVIHIAVKDTGCGIHPEDLHHIFKRFYRSRYSKDTQGIGLGLPLVKSVVEAHGGTVEVDSRMGAGTTFIMNFLIPTKL